MNEQLIEKYASITGFSKETATSAYKKAIKLTMDFLSNNDSTIHHPGLGHLKLVKENSVKDPLTFNTAEDADRRYNNVNFRLAHWKNRSILHNQIINCLTMTNSDLINKRILDVGCGLGGLIYKLSNKYPENYYFGVDHSEVAINTAKSEMPNLKFWTHDIYKPLSDKYDIILCEQTLEHLLYPKQALLTLLESLQCPSGIAIITVPNGRFDQLGQHINFWSPESWSVWLSDILCESFTFTTEHWEKGTTPGGNLVAIISCP